MTEIDEIIQSYIAEAQSVIDSAKPSDGLFGFGRGPKDDPCHMKFYDAVSDAASRGDAYETVSAIIKAERNYECPKMCSWMLSAIHSLAIPRIGELSSAQREELRNWYDDNVPKRTRLPVQKQFYKALK